MAQAAVNIVLPIISGGISSTATLLIGFLSDIILYRFINVQFHPLFDNFCNQLSSAQLIPNLFEDTHQATVVSNSTIGKFYQWQISTSLLNNSGDTISKDATCLALILVLILTASLFKRTRGIAKYIENSRDALKWNTLISYYLGDFSEFLLFSLVEFREGNLSDSFMSFSFLACILILVTYVALLVYFGDHIESKKV